jgi:hypothetical protein
MAARREWTEWHLTPRGWERGAMRTQGKNNWKDEPEDRVLSYQCKEEETTSSGVSTLTEETWRSKTATDIDELLKKHGPCPKSL